MVVSGLIEFRRATVYTHTETHLSPPQGMYWYPSKAQSQELSSWALMCDIASTLNNNLYIRTSAYGQVYISIS